MEKLPPSSASLSKKSCSSTGDVPEEKSNSSSSRFNDPDDQVRITIKGQEGKKTEYYFVVKRSKKMKKLFESYCNNTGQEIQAMRFLYKGNRVYGFHTPLALGVKKGKKVSIDAMTYVHGGGGSGSGSGGEFTA